MINSRVLFSLTTIVLVALCDNYPVSATINTTPNTDGTFSFALNLTVTPRIPAIQICIQHYGWYSPGAQFINTNYSNPYLNYPTIASFPATINCTIYNTNYFAAVCCPPFQTNPSSTSSTFTYNGKNYQKMTNTTNYYTNGTLIDATTNQLVSNFVIQDFNTQMVASNNTITTSLSLPQLASQTGFQMELNPCMVIADLQSDCSSLIYNIMGFSINTCSIITDAGVKYVKITYGNLASTALSFSMKLLSMTCSSGVLQTLAVKVLSLVSAVEQVIMLPFILAENLVSNVTISSSSKCVDWDSKVFILENETPKEIKAKELKVNDKIMTINNEGKVEFVEVIMHTLHPGKNANKEVLQILAARESGEQAELKIVPDHILPIQREKNGEILFLPAGKVIVGDKLSYAKTPDSIEEKVTVVEIKEGSVEGLSHIWTTSTTHCTNGILTSSMIEGDPGLFGHAWLTIAYKLNRQLPTFLWKLVKDQ